MSRTKKTWRLLSAAAAGILLVAVAGCHHHGSRDTGEPSRLFFYSANKQSVARQDRDRYDCMVLAREQTGFDPSRPSLSTGQRLEVTAVSAPPGAATTPAPGSKGNVPNKRGGVAAFRDAVVACLEDRGYVVY